MVSQVFMDNIFQLYGMPQYITMNHDPTFTGNFWKELSMIQGTQLILAFPITTRSMVRQKLPKSVWKHI
jgi:hypothetical protein